MDFKSYGILDDPGCYAVFSPKSECLYVGRSVYILRRIFAHYYKNPSGERTWTCAGASEWYVQCDKPYAPYKSMIKIWFTEQIVELELALISYFKPKHNRMTYGRVR